jgi:hypothetical protein
MSTFPTTGTAINAGQMAIADNGRIRPGRTISPLCAGSMRGRFGKATPASATATRRIHYLDIDKGFFNGMTIQRNYVQILFDDIFCLRPGKITVKDPQGKLSARPISTTTRSFRPDSIRQIAYDTTRQAYYNVRRDFFVREIRGDGQAGC